MQYKTRKKIKTDFIINEWQKSNIDVSRFFKDIPEIYIYKCLDTGYKFFYPFNTAGDDQFYQDLQQFDWYYMKDKWENDEAMRKSKEKGLNIYKETIQEHAKTHQKRYDIVCSFQVMEHIPEIGEAVRASIDTLKPGGKLIISVPNNNSIINQDPKGLLNRPPHHIGLWDKKSLSNLEKIFNIKLEKIKTEPLQRHHYKTYYNMIFGNKINDFFGDLAIKINIVPKKIK